MSPAKWEMEVKDEGYGWQGVKHTPSSFEFPIVGLGLPFFTCSYNKDLKLGSGCGIFSFFSYWSVRRSKLATSCLWQLALRLQLLEPVKMSPSMVLALFPQSKAHPFILFMSYYLMFVTTLFILFKSSPNQIPRKFWLYHIAPHHQIHFLFSQFHSHKSFF